MSSSSTRAFVTAHCLKTYVVVVGLQLLVLGFTSPNAWGQAGLRESLELLDRDEDGQLEPDEITPLSRPYLERIAKARRLSLDRTNSIEKWQEAARVYYAMQNGVAGESVRASRERVLKGFGVEDDEVMIPEFGVGEIKYPYTPDDLDEAEDTIRRWDRDRDGYLDRREAARARWTHRDPFSMDLDNDDRLSRLELAQRYARRRAVQQDAGELVQRAVRVGNGIRSS
ncbi:MAG: calcium sensor EFh, partial [Planctomycetota bacterium]